MEYTRSELLPGVYLSHLQSDKFKTACMSVSLLSQLSRETASLNALIPQVLRRGTSRCPDMEALGNRLDELYGAVITPVVRRFGEIHSIGFFASFPEPEFLPGGEALLNEMTGLMGEMLLSPNTRGGLLLPAYVDSEREKMLALIRSRVNNKRSYAMQRCIEEMCCCEDFAVNQYGDEEHCAAIHYKKLTRHYRSLLQHCPVELFYCGRAPLRDVERAFREALAGMPRGEIDGDIGTDVRMNALEAEPRYCEEHMDVTQGKLVLGFRLGECMEEPDIPAIQVFNTVYGSGPTSKLFLNVREKLQLCYYAGSAAATRKGLLFVSSGISFDKLEAAKAEILAQLEAVKNGSFTEEELAQAKRAVISDYRSLPDSQTALESFWLGSAVDGRETSPEELAALTEEVTREDVMAIAKSTELDLVYFLCAGDAEEETEDDDTEA